MSVNANLNCLNISQIELEMVEKNIKKHKVAIIFYRRSSQSRLYPKDLIMFKHDAYGMLNRR